MKQMELRIQELEAINDTLIETNKKIQNDLVIQREVHDKEIQSMQRELEEIQKSAQRSIKQQLNKIEEEKNIWKEEKHSLQIELSSTMEAERVMHEKNSELEQQVSAEKIDKEELRSIIASLEKEVAELRGAKKILIREVKSLRARELEHQKPPTKEKEITIFPPDKKKGENTSISPDTHARNDSTLEIRHSRGSEDFHRRDSDNTSTTSDFSRYDSIDEKSHDQYTEGATKVSVDQLHIKTVPLCTTDSNQDAQNPDLVQRMKGMALEFYINRSFKIL